MRSEPFPTLPAERVPWLTIAEMAEADRLATEDFGIDLLQMMEHAGAALAELVVRLAPSGPVAVLAGAGNNGGGGLCAARHLTNRGREVTISLAGSPGPAAAHHLATLAEMGVNPVDGIPDAPVIVDALVGYGLDGPLRGRVTELAETTRGRYVASLDFPSGHGFPGGVEADAVLTLALPKEGLRGARPLYLADIGLPAALWLRLGFEVGPIFASGRIVEIVSPEQP